MKTKTKHKTHKELKAICDKLWAEIIKKRAGYKSEISGREGKQIGGEFILNAHHLIGKSTLRLRYELTNGICITKGEHNFGAHGNWESQQKFQDKVKKLRYSNIFDKLLLMKHTGNKTDLGMIEIYLRQELANLTSSKD